MNTDNKCGEGLGRVVWGGGDQWERKGDICNTFINNKDRFKKNHKEEEIYL